MHTRHVEYLLPDFVTGKLEEPLRSGVESHLAECAVCKAELETLKHAFRTITGSSVKVPPDAYFNGILPRVRLQLEQPDSPGLFTRPLVSRLALPLAAGVLILALLLHVPVSINNDELAQNPLRPVLNGVGSEELVEIALDQVHLQHFSNALGENETSSMLAVSILRSEYFLSDPTSPSVLEDPVLGPGVAEDLEALNDADLEVLVAQLSERTSL